MDDAEDGNRAGADEEVRPVTSAILVPLLAWSDGSGVVDWSLRFETDRLVGADLYPVEARTSAPLNSRLLARQLLDNGRRSA